MSQVKNEGAVLSVSGPDTVFRREFEAGETPTFSVFDTGGKHRPDGSYTWELRTVPALSDEIRERLAAIRATENEEVMNNLLAELRASGALPADESLVQTGSFFIENGAIVATGLAEPGSGKPRQRKASNSSGPLPTTAAEQVIPDDLIVQGSTCVGLDCVNNELFSFDTIRLKENNLRIHFDDTSSTAGFPANDWRLIANDSASGGQSKFSIEDSTGARTPFTVEAGATTNSIYVDSTGRVGFRTATPVLDLHVNTFNTPALRLEQNNSGGFPAQTWDIGANEAQFFIRDVTGGSLLPFRIRPGAPTSSIDVSSLGRIGFGTASPAVKLDARGDTAADASLALNTFSVSESPQVMLRRASGSRATPVATQRGDILGTLAFRGHDGAGLTTLGGATVHAFAEQLWGPSNTGASLILSTTGVNDGQAEPRLTIRHNGFVGIGTERPKEKLEVFDGNILVTGGSFIADGTILNVPDYVFEPDYKLMPIAELKAFIEQEKHLPNIPDRGKFQAQGLDLSEFQMRLLEKVEELTLYAVRQHDEIQALQSQLTELRKALVGETPR